MNKTFQVQGRIRTLAKLYPGSEFEIRGYSFNQWSFNRSAPSGGGWHVMTTLEAKNLEDCRSKFFKELIDLTDRIAFVSQCYAACEDEPYLIFPNDSNAEKQFFYHFSNERKATGLWFSQNEQDALNKLEEYPVRGNAFRLIREATNAPWFYTRFSMLAAALEAIAGERGMNNAVRNKEYIQDVILRDGELEKNIFAFGDGLRNQVLHGKWIDEELHGGKSYIAEIHSSIRNYFREHHGVSLNEKIVNPMRNPNENFNVWHGWLKPKAPNYEIDLREIWSLSKPYFRGIGGEESTQFRSRFEIITAPSDID